MRVYANSKPNSWMKTIFTLTIIFPTFKFSMIWSQWHFDTSSLTLTVSRLYTPFSTFSTDADTTGTKQNKRYVKNERKDDEQALLRRLFRHVFIFNNFLDLVFHTNS